MTSPPQFASLQDYLSRIPDVEFWAPHIQRVLERHELSGAAPTSGFNASNPTFVCGDVVVKLFGFSHFWRAAHARELAAHRLIATDPEVAAPRLLGHGDLFERAEDPWSYLITARVPGVASWRAGLSRPEKEALAGELGRQVRRVHALPCEDIGPSLSWSDVNVKEGAAKSSLPLHLVAQVDEFLLGLPPFELVFVNGDLVANHAFVENGRLTGIIDWGDAMIADRHYELIQLYRDLFDCDSALFRTFLEASSWPVGRNFSRQALGHGLYRQAVGFIQHHTIDVFEPIAAKFPLDRIGTLNELAALLFDV